MDISEKATTGCHFGFSYSVQKIEREAYRRNERKRRIIVKNFSSVLRASTFLSLPTKEALHIQHDFLYLSVSFLCKYTQECNWKNG